MQMNLTSIIALFAVWSQSQALAQAGSLFYNATGKGTLTAKATEDLSSEKERTEHKSDFGYHAKVDFSTQFDAKAVDGKIEVYCKLLWHAFEVMDDGKHTPMDRQSPEYTEMKGDSGWVKIFTSRPGESVDVTPEPLSFTVYQDVPRKADPKEESTPSGHLKSLRWKMITKSDNHFPFAYAIGDVEAVIAVRKAGQ